MKPAPVGCAVAKYQHDNREISRYRMVLNSAGSISRTIHQGVLLSIYAAKVFVSVWLCDIVMTASVATIAFAIFMTSSLIVIANPYKESNSCHESQPFGIPVDPLIKKDPIFTPKYATIILINQEVIEGKIVGITSEYVEVIVDGELRFINQKDISEIRRM